MLTVPADELTTRRTLALGLVRVEHVEVVFYIHVWGGELIDVLEVRIDLFRVRSLPYMVGIQPRGQEAVYA